MNVITELKIESLIVDKKWVIQQMIRDENKGGWCSDYDSSMRELNDKIENLHNQPNEGD